MDLVFDIASSIEFWRQRYPVNRTPTTPSLLSPCDCASVKKDVLALLPEWVDADFLAPSRGVFHALTFDCCEKRNLKHVAVHTWSGLVPEGSFYALKNNVYVESPEFMFLHAATILSLPALIAFGDELCGKYSFNRKSDRGFEKREIPLLEKRQLEHYLQRSFGCRGHKLAMRAFPHIVEGSASPMETFDEMTMCLPYRYGGYGISQPIMNHVVELTPKAARIAKRRRCFLDMGYPEFKLDIEHHGKLDHFSDDGKASDFARVNALREMGFEVIELSKGQVGDVIAYEYIVERVAAITGKRVSKKALGATPARIALRNDLFNWNRSYGAIR